MKKIVLLYFWLFSIYTFSQNLVPNPSFEEINPTCTSGGVARIRFWFGATGSPGDYYSRNNADKLSGVPLNLFGNQEPHSGNAYSGFCIEDFVEYLETILLKPLVKGQEYNIRFYISRADKQKASVKEMGVLFLSKKKEYFLGEGIRLKPQVEFINEKGYNNTNEWTELSATYIAEGFEKVIVIGHFIYNEVPGYSGGKAHYYIDDVSITPIISEPVEDDSSKNIVNQPQAPLIDTLRLEDLNFKFGTAQLIGDYTSKLKNALNYLLSHSDKIVRVEGHTDNIGSEQSNKKLSEARAKAVANYLIFKGIDEGRISFKGFGSLIPIDNNKTDLGRKRNRRVDLIIESK